MPKYRKKNQAAKYATQWFKNGDHPDDDCKMLRPDPKSTTQFDPHLSEGKVVRMYTPPGTKSSNYQESITALRELESGRCYKCGKLFRLHGSVDALEGQQIVCPGDWIITGCDGTYYKLPDWLFKEKYELVEEKTND